MHISRSTKEGRPSVALYHAKAREMRAMADRVGDAATKTELIMLAIGYDLLAQHLDVVGTEV